MAGENASLLKFKQDIKNSINNPDVRDAFKIALISTFPPSCQNDALYHNMGEAFANYITPILAASLSEYLSVAVRDYVASAQVQGTCPSGAVTGAVTWPV